MLLSPQYFAGVSHDCGVGFSWPERLHVVSSEVTACSRLLHLCFIRTRELVSRYAHPQRYGISNTFFGVFLYLSLRKEKGYSGVMWFVVSFFMQSLLRSKVSELKSFHIYVPKSMATP